MIIDWDNQPIGQMPDYALAKRLRVCLATVQYQRHKRGHPPFVKATGSGVARGIDWDAQPLATTPADALAKRLGVSRASVDAAAKVRGIKCPPLRPAVAPVAVATDLSDGYDYARLLSRLPRVVRPMLERRRLEHWSEDVVQHAAMKIHELHRSGRRCSHRATRFCVLGAIEEMFGTKLKSMHFAPLEAVRHADAEQPCPAFRSIALWRLQDRWGTLTDSERAAVRAKLTGDTADSDAMVRARVKLESPCTPS